MGRKGMKGFIKSAARPSAKPEEEEQPSAAEAPAATPAASSSTSSQAKYVAAPAVSTPAAAAAGTGSDDEDNTGQESRSKMLQRHKRELLAHKKAVQRMGKKSKDELAKLDAEIEARHAQELQQLEAAAAAAASSSSEAAAGPAAPAGAPAAAAQAVSAANGSAAAADRASKYLKDLSMGDEQEAEQEQKGSSKKPTKAQKRREKQAARDAERDARIASELDALGPSEREEEEQALKALLAPLGLGVKEIRADGHCLYRSLEDQLSAAAAAAAAATAAAGGGDDAGDSAAAAEPDVPNYQELRELAADYIRQHKDQFSPFLLPEDEEEDPEEHYEKYCYALETTAAWGGHLELSALANALQRQVKVHAVGMQTVSLGDEYGGEGKPPALQLCYLRHAFGLGEHYNSTKRARFVRFSLDEEREGEEGEEEEQQEQEGEGQPAVEQEGGEGEQ